MLSFDIGALHTTAAAVSGDLAADDPVWDDADVRPAKGIHVSGRFSATGGGQYYFKGHMAGEIATECRRCLSDAQASVSEEVQIIFADPGAVGEDDPDVYPVSDRAKEIDLRAAVREQWLLTVPSLVLCREDCRGLCPSCGTDLNLGACECAPAMKDPRWTAMEQIRQQLPD